MAGGLWRFCPTNADRCSVAEPAEIIDLRPLWDTDRDHHYYGNGMRNYRAENHTR